MANIKKISLCLNVDDPEQKELFDFVTKLPNGSKRNGSSFLKTLVDREYQSKKRLGTTGSIKASSGGIKYSL